MFRLLVIPVLFLLGNTAARADDAKLVKDQNESWFGKFIDGKRYGYIHLHNSQEADGTYSFKQTTVMLLLTDNGAQRVEVSQERRLDAKPPFALLEEKAITRHQLLHRPGAPIIQEVIRKRTPDGFEEIVRQGDVTRTRKLPPAEQAASRETVDVEAWVKRKPQVGDRRALPGYKADDPPGSLVLTTILDEPDGPLYEIETRNGQGRRVSITWYDTDGRMMRSREGRYETRREAAAQAQDIRLSDDLNVLSNVRLDRPLGNPRNLARLVLEVRGDVTTLADGPGQRLRTDPDTGRHILELGQLSDRWPLDAAKRDNYLAETAEFPIRHANVVALARQAVGNAETDLAKVKALVRFVHEHMRYVRDSRNPSVLEIIQLWEGDCSEYTSLLVTLARASGIPARSISGHAYIAEDGMFVPHAWAEVVVDGHWLGVDPTAGATELHPGYLRCDPKISGYLENELQLHFVSAEIKVPTREPSQSGFNENLIPPILFLAGWCLLALFNGRLAKRKGRPANIWLLLSLFGGPAITWILFRLQPEAVAAEQPAAEAAEIDPEKALAEEAPV